MGAASQTRCIAVLLLCCLCIAADGEERPTTIRTPFSADSNTFRHPQDTGTDPYLFVSSGDTSVVVGAHYAAGLLKRWLLGEQYRDVWTTPLTLPVIDLDATAGGLTPIERGGGNQTSSLHLLGGDGHYYDLRSVDKSAARSVPDTYQGTVIAGLVQDQFSALNPVGALILPPLADAAGILHTRPKIVVIPDTPRLGAYRREFAGMIALFERKPDEDQSGAARFGFARNVIGTDRLFEKLREDSAARIDERAYVRARLFDMLIGDWDRHQGQWRWAEFETRHGSRYVPVPVDRDGAFAKFDGLLNRLGRLSGNMMLRRLTNFDEDIADVLGLNWQAMWLDRRLASAMDRAEWVEIADSLRYALSDGVIDDAVRLWPDPVYEKIGATTAQTLKSRRESLPSAASRYYELLADTLKIYGSDADERFDITQLSDTETRVVLSKRVPRDSVAFRELARRIIRHQETVELQLYRFGGTDEIVRHGLGVDAPLVRIVGGTGTAVIVDSTVTSPPRDLRSTESLAGRSVPPDRASAPATD